MSRRVPTRLVMAADYLADPLWTREPNGRTGAMVPLEQLPLSQATRARLRAWAARFDRLMGTGYEWPNAAEHRTWLAADGPCTASCASNSGQATRCHSSRSVGRDRAYRGIARAEREIAIVSHQLGYAQPVGRSDGPRRVCSTPRFCTLQQCRRALSALSGSA